MNEDEQVRAWRDDDAGLLALIRIAEARRNAWAAGGDAAGVDRWQGFLSAFWQLREMIGPPDALTVHELTVPQRTPPPPQIDESTALGDWTSPNGRTVRVALRHTIYIDVSGVQADERNWFLEDVLPAAGRLAEARLRVQEVRLTGAHVRWPREHREGDGS